MYCCTSCYLQDILSATLKKNTNIYIYSNMNYVIEPAIFELGSGCTMYYHIGWGFIVFLSNYIYSIYFCLEITVQIEDLHLLLLLSSSISNEGNVQQPFIYYNTMLLFYGKPKRKGKETLIFVSFCIMGLFIVMLSFLLVSSTGTLKVWTLKKQAWEMEMQ